MRTAEIWDRLVSILYPKRCVLCNEVVAYDDLCCNKCTPAPQGLIKKWEQGQLAAMVSPLEYGGAIRMAVIKLKSQPDRRLVAFFSEEMGKMVGAQWQVPFDLLIPVPNNPAALEERGFNQAELLSRSLGQLLKVHTATNLLLRKDSTAPQHTLSAHDRMANAVQSYALQPRAAIEGKRVLLVDDVYTTGATLNACSALLRQAGAAQVCGVTATYN